MSFWAGVVQGVKDVDVLKEKEALAEERKAAAEKAEAWQLKVFEYGRKRDEASDEYNASRLRLEEDSLLLKYLPEGGGTGSGRSGAGAGTGASGKGPTLKHVLAVTKKGGVSDETLIPFLANPNLGPKAIQATFDQWKVWEKAHANTPGGPGSMDEFFSKTIVTTTPGEDVTEEMVAARAAQFNRDPSEVVAGMTVGERIRRSMTTPGEFNVETPIAVDPLKQDEVTALTAGADKQMEAVLEERFNKLRVLKNELDNSGKVDPDLTTRFVEAERALKDFKDGANTLDITRKFGANAILSSLVNAPGALGVNSFGLSYNRAIESRTYDNEEQAVEAFRSGELLADDYYVIGKDIHVAEADRFNAAVNPTSANAKKIPEEGVGGPAVGQLPDGFTGNGDRGEEFVRKSPQGFIDVTGLNRAGIKDAILNKGLTVGGTIIYNGTTKVLTPEFMSMLGVETTPAVGVEPSADIANGPTNLDIEQTRIPPEDLRTTVSTGDERPVVEGIGDLAEPSVLDSVTSVHTASKGAPLDPEEELAVGIEAIVKALTGSGLDQGDLGNLIIELNTKYGEDKVREALDLAMNT